MLRPRNETKRKDAIAHLVGVYPTVTETFIPQYIRQQRVYESALVVEQYNRNQPEQVSLDIPLLRLDQVWQKGTWQWFLGQVDRRILHRPPYLSVLKMTFRQQSVKVLHAHFGYHGLRCLPIKRATHLPMITTFYGNDVAQINLDQDTRKAYSELFDEGDLFLAEGPHLRQSLIMRGCPTEKTAIQRIAIDPSSLEFHPRYYNMGEPLRILFCGRFVEKKGLRYAIEALASVVQISPACEMLIIGDGPLRQELESLAIDLQVDKHLHLLGYQPYQQYISEIYRAHILVAPSVTATDGDTEGGAPTVLLEAQATGLPIVTTTHADIPNIVSGGESAVLVPERDPEAIAEALIALADHPERWQKMGEAGRAFVEKYHDVRLEVTALEAQYRRLVDVK